MSPPVASPLTASRAVAPPVIALVASLPFLLAAAPADVLVRVDGEAITRADLDLFLALRGVTGPASPAFRERALDELIDRTLVRRFLAGRKAEPDAEELDLAVRAAKSRLAASGRDPGAELRKLGIDDARLKAELALPLAWGRHVRRAVTDKQVADRFEADRRRFDGTTLRVSQILARYEPGESMESAATTTAKLDAVRQEIASGRMSFADAARKHSQAPTASAGGDVGWIAADGDLPRPVVRAAFALEKGAVSGVVLSPFGAHLVTVVDERPGDGSLEDARPAVLDELSDALWSSTVAAARKDAKITRSDE